MSASTALWTACERVLPDTGPLVVGVSGGCDSMTLLHVLKQGGADVVACHVNVGLRGAESDADEALVREMCAAWGIPFRSERVDLPAGNVQDAARRARRSFFDRILRETGASAILLAHHQDDQVETILMQWLRGGREDALTGMAARSGLYLRPWLEIPAAEIRESARSNGIPWREDRSNADRRYLRNRIRHELMPLIERHRLLDIAAASADLGRVLDALLEAWTHGPTLSDRMFQADEPDIARLAVHRFARRFNLRVSDEECGRLFAAGYRPGKRIGPFVRETDGWSLLRPEPPPSVPEGCVIRPWRPGDRYDGRKVSDRMSDAKWPHWMRLGAWVVEDAAGRIVSLRKPVSSEP